MFDTAGAVARWPLQVVRGVRRRLRPRRGVRRDGDAGGAPPGAAAAGGP